ncbi:MAG: type IV pilus assembly protein PilM [Patescibacteria group bacterium]
MSLLRPFQNAIGIDISDAVIRMVQLKKHRHGFALRSVSARPVPNGLIQEGEIRDPQGVIAILKDVLAQPTFKHPSSKAAIVCLPERKIFTKIIELPNVLPEAFTAALHSGLAENIPLNLDEAYLDWQYVRPPQPAEKTVRVVVSVAPQLLVEGYTSVLESVGLVPLVLEPESAALCRVALDPAALQGSHLIIDLGASRTGIIITEGDVVAYSSTLSLAGGHLTAMLQMKLGLTLEEAEEAKRICGLDPRKGKGAVRSIIEPELKPLTQRVTEVVSYYEEHVADDLRVQDITLVGGGAKLIGMAPFIQSALHLPVRIGDWPASISPPPPPLDRVGPSYLTAVGLAMRGVLNVPWFPARNV